MIMITIMIMGTIMRRIPTGTGIAIRRTTTIMAMTMIMAMTTSMTMDMRTGQRTIIITSPAILRMVNTTSRFF